MTRATERSGLIWFASVAVMLCTPNAAAQQWISQFGTSGAEEASGVVPDGAGGGIIAGWTNGSLGAANLGSDDAFLARYDSAGNQLWIRQFGTSGIDGVRDLAADGTGSVMVAGNTGGSLGGPNLGSDDAFLARYDSAGNQLWITQFGTAFADEAIALAPDGAAGVFVAGETSGSMAAPNVNNSGDVFIARYDSAGAQLWVRQFGTDDEERPFAIAHDGTGGVYITGETTGSLAGPISGAFDAFLARYDKDGNQLWVRQLSSSGNDAGTGVASDGAGGVLVSGFTDGGLGGPNLGDQDAFFARYDGAGNQLWIRQFGTIEFDSPQGLTSDGAGGALVVGVTAGDLGGPLTGFADVFLAHYDTDGNHLSTRQFGSAELDVPQSVALDKSGAVLIAGFTQGDLGGPNAGEVDAFLARLTETCYPDCDQSTGVGVLDIFDFLCFQNSFVNSQTYACDCDTSTGLGVCDIFDFLCFQDAFVGGCP